MSPEGRLQEIRERLSKVDLPPAGWRIYKSDVIENYHSSVCATIAKVYTPGAQELIANAPSDLEYLLDLLAERDRQVGVMRAALDKICAGDYSALIIARKALEDGK